MRKLTMLLLLTGCDPDINVLKGDSGDSGGSDTTVDSGDTDTDTDTEIDMDAITIDGVSPGYGPLSGGQDVLISGGPFSDSAVVFFGEIQATTSLITANEIIASVPAFDTEGWATVSVIDGNQGGELELAYRYFANAEGLAGALGWSTWTELTGGYWEGAYSDGGLRFLFIEPTDLHTWELTVPALDTCVVDGEHSYTDDIFVLDLGVEELSLTPQVGAAFSVPFNADNYFFELNPLSQTQYVSGGGYDLDPIVGGLFDGVEVEQLFRNPGPVDVIEPDISGTFAPTVSPDQMFRWESGGYSWLEIAMGVTSADGTTFDDFVTCIVTDDGEFQMDDTKFTKWASGRQINVYVTGVREDGAVLPFNFSDSRIVGQNQLIGAGFSL